jgi:hypothetical protein
MNPLQQTNEQTNPLEQPQQQMRGKRKSSGPPKTTGRKKDDNQRVKIKVRRRVKMSRFQLYHILTSDCQRKMIPKNIPNKYNFFGTVISRGKNKSSWNVKWDVLPVDDCIISNIARTKLTMVEDGEEEKPINDGDHLDEVEINSEEEDNALSSPEKSGKKSSEEIFCSLDKDNLKDAEIFTMQWGSGESDVINWRILKDSEFLTEDDFPLDFPDVVHYHAAFQDGDVSELDEPTNFFFKYVFPDIDGKIHLFVCCH